MTSVYYLPSDIHVINSLQDRERAMELRGTIYSGLFPQIDDPEKPDIYDFNAVLWAAKDPTGSVVATARMAYDDPQIGLPSERYLHSYIESRRQQNAKISEYGRFVNVESGNNKKNLTKAFYARLYFHACCENIDTVLIVAPRAKQTLYVDCFGAEILCDDIGENFGSDSAFAAFAWDIRRTKHDFFSWMLSHQNQQCPVRGGQQ